MCTVSKDDQAENKDISCDQHGNRVWHAGTLVYTRRQLVWVFFWLLLGDFANTIAITAIPMMLPLFLKRQNYSTDQIAWFTGMGYLAAMIVSPLTGMWSDRLRSRWGRRRPFILLTAPVWCVGMLLIPFMKSFLGMNIAVGIVSFAGAAAVVSYYLYNDVIPGELMGRFVGAFRFIGFGGALVFQYGIFRYFDQSPVFVWWFCGIVSLVFTTVMLLMVREGQYAPPEKSKSLISNINIFIKDGLGSRYMWMLWLTLGMTALGTPAANTFFVLFFERQMNMNSTHIGMMMGTGTAVAILLALPSGWLVDKLGANLVWGVSGALVGVSQIVMYFFALNQTMCWVLYISYYGINMILAAALLPMLFSHLPKEKFGQLTSCQSLVIQGLLFIGTMVLGSLIKLFDDNYRVAFLYGGIIYCFVPVFLFFLLRCKNPFAHLETSMKNPKSKTEREQGERASEGSVDKYV